MGKEIHVAYDARLSLGKYRGMGRFLRQLIAGYEQKFIGLCAREESDPDLRLHADGASLYPYWEQVEVPRMLRSLGIDTYLAPYNTAPLRIPDSVRLLLVVHDLIFLGELPSSRSLYQKVGRWYRRLVVPSAIRRASHIITVSEYTAAELRERFGITDTMITVIPNTLAESWYGQDTERIPRQRFVLIVSGEAPSKNLHRALEGFSKFRQAQMAQDVRSYTLKIAGVSPQMHAHFGGLAKALGIDDAIEFLSYLPTAELQKLYRNASLVMVPSLAEGFGIPLLEAMASGTPCISSSATCLPEVGGDAALYFDPYSTSEMASALERTLTDASIRQAMTQRGYQQALKFHPRSVELLRRDIWARLGI